MSAAYDRMWRKVYATGDFSLLARVECLLSDGGLTVMRRTLGWPECRPNLYELRVPAADGAEAERLILGKGY